MQEIRYEKASDTELRTITINTGEVVDSLEKLKAERTHLEEQKQQIIAQKEREKAEEIAGIDVDISKLDLKISEAEKLGVVEVVTDEVVPDNI